MIQYPSDYKPNYKSSSDLIIGNILHLLLFNNANQDTLFDSFLTEMNFLKKKKIKIRPDRSFPRERIFPVSKQYQTTHKIISEK